MSRGRRVKKKLMAHSLAGGSEIHIPGGGINLSREGPNFHLNENEGDKNGLVLMSEIRGRGLLPDSLSSLGNR